MSDTLVNRLRGRYEVGPNAEFGIREFDVPAINIEAVNNSEKCGCYHCISVFESSEITEWCDGEKTALCPSCGIDSVIPNETDINVLTTIWKHWFAWPDE